MEKLNIAEILKDCPKGMKLDCTMYGEVTLSGVNDEEGRIYPIKIIRKDGQLITLTKYGQYRNLDFAKCVIFPKGKTTWEGFQRPFNDGDIIYNRLQKRICIYHHKEDETPCVSHCRYNEYHKTFEILDCDIYINKQDYRLATEKEQQKLFDAIEANGYYWDAETKTFEKLIIPKFKAGDTIKNKNDKWQAKRTIRNYVAGIGYYTTINDWVRIDDQDEWELVPNKFNITTFKPFDKVLVRCNELEIWHISFFEKYNRKYSRYPFVCLNGNKYSQCIPYKDNEHLLDTADDCDDFYKTW